MRDKKGMTHVIAIAAFAAFIALGLACATSPTPTRTKPAASTNTQAKPAAPQSQAAKAIADQTAELTQIAANNPNDAKAQYDLGRRLYSPDNNYVQASAAWEKALAIDPDYRITERFQWYPKTASTFGVSITRNLIFGDFSLFFFLGIAYHDGATLKSRNASSSAIGFQENEKTGTLEKSLAAFRKGYEIDIEGGKNADTNLKILYLAYIAKISDLLGRKNEADISYKELATVATLTPEIAQRINWGQKQGHELAAFAVDQDPWWNRVPEFAQMSLDQLKSMFNEKKVATQGQLLTVEQYPAAVSRSVFMIDSKGKVNRWVVVYPNLDSADSSDYNNMAYQFLLESFTAAYGDPERSNGAQKFWSFAGSNLPKDVIGLTLDIEQRGAYVTYMYGF